jgi:hypothetical protein
MIAGIRGLGTAGKERPEGLHDERPDVQGGKHQHRRQSGEGMKNSRPPSVAVGPVVAGISDQKQKQGNNDVGDPNRRHSPELPFDDR